MSEGNEDPHVPQPPRLHRTDGPEIIGKYDAKGRQAQQVQAQAQQASAKTDPMEEITKLGELKQKGLLTDEEFQKMKANLIAKL
jgi:membrane protease subunit (stomatin/prohibitin family)